MSILNAMFPRKFIRYVYSVARASRGFREISQQPSKIWSQDHEIFQVDKNTQSKIWQYANFNHVY